MSTRVSASLLVVIALVFAFNVADFAAQDPAPAAQSTQTDLSGTYAGTFNCESAGLMGDTTLTITGNQFTTADGKSGRIVASSTGGYTAVALQIGESTPAATTGMTPTSTAAAAPPPTIISLRARKSGERLTLMSVPGSMQKCSFTPTRTTARGRRQRTPAATGTEVGNPANVPVPTTTPTETESPMPEQTPAPTPNPSPEASPEPNPSPSPQPTQMPTPYPNPSPSPTASPSPTPTPSPAGQHR